MVKQCYNQNKLCAAVKSQDLWKQEASGLLSY